MALNCINKNSKEFISLVVDTGINDTLLAAKISIWQSQNNTTRFPTIADLNINQPNVVDFNLKALNILTSKKAEDIFNKGKKNGWDLNKILTELQIPKEQKQIILDKNIKNSNILNSKDELNKIAKSNSRLSKGRDIRRESSLNLEKGFEKFYSQFTHAEKPDKWIDYLDSNTTDTVATTEDKIARMQQVFDAVVIIDTEMEVSGKLLGANNPISQRNGGKPVIVINPNLLFGDTVFHEFGHLYIDMLGGMSDPVIADAIEFLKGSSLWFRVQDAYPELSGEALAKEVLATALGIEADILYKDNPTKRSIWTRLKAAILNAVNKLLGNKYSPNALEKLTSEMLSGKTRLSATARFNTLVDQNSKLNISGDVTPAKIDKLFSHLTKRFDLTVNAADVRGYTDTEDNKFHTTSVSTFAKNLTRGAFGVRKGDFDKQFDKGWELTETNNQVIFNSSSIPMALDLALNEFFRGELSNDLPTVSGASEYWHTFYIRNIGEDALFSLDSILLDNLDLINERAQELQNELSLPTLAGDIIHNGLENYIKDGIQLPENIVDPRDKLLKIIDKIITEGRKNGSKFYTEQMLFSESAKTPGTADLIEITKDGKFRIYDFKTMKSFEDHLGYPKNNWQMYVPNGYINQILTYSTILEEYGIKPADNHLNIIAIAVDKSDMEVGNPNSTVKIEEVRLANILEIAKKDKSIANEVKRANIKILRAFKNPNKLKQDFDLDLEIADVNKLAAKLARAVEDFKRLKTDLSANKIMLKFEKEVKELMGKKNKTIILSYLNNIREALTDTYAKASSKGYLDSNYLKDLEFLTQAASFLPDIRKFLSEQGSDYYIDHVDIDQLFQLLNDTESTLSDVLKLKDHKTKEKAVEILAANSNFMEGLWREKFEMEARKELTKPNKDQIEEYVYAKLKEHANEIELKEYKYWESIFVNGYTDIRYFEWLIADPGMNKSQFVQVTKNVMDKADLDVRIDLDDSISNLVEWHDGLNINKTGDPRKVWSKFIQTARYTDLDGKKHTYMHSSLIPETTSDYRELVVAYNFQKEYLEREILKAKKANNTKKYEELIEKQKELRDSISLRLKKESKKERPHAKFAKLSPAEQDALRYIHRKLEEADTRLVGRPFAKLVRDAGGQKIYNLPKVRKSRIESAYDANGAIKRFTSGIRDFFRPPADEDELNLTNAEANEASEDFKTNSTDIEGNPLYEVPVFYRRTLEDPELQSFDIPTLLAMNEETTIQYEHFSAIEPDLFMITQSLKTTKALKTDAVVNKRVVDRLKGGLEKSLNSESNRVLSAVQSSINNRLYKRTYGGVYSKTNYKLIKGAEALNKFTSMLLLSGNFGSASMTGLQGSLYRMIEGIAGEDFSTKDVGIGSTKAWADIHNLIADSQRQFPKSKTNLLIRRFGLDTEFKALVNKFVQDNFATKNLDEASMFALTSISEKIVTASLMYTLMNNIKVMNSNGDFINEKGKKVSQKDAMSLDEAYTIENGKLVLNKHVTYTERNLTHKFRDNINGEKTVAATEISNFIRSKYADLYGQYNQDMKSVAEMHVIGKLAFSMKKWIPRGYHRRWRGISSVWNTFETMKDDANLSKRFYSQDQKKFQEGYYTTGLRWIYSMMKEMKNKEVGFMTAAKNVKSTMSTHERANLIRLGSEMAIMALTAAAAMLLQSMVFDLGDDEDKHKDKLYFAAYLAERIRIESMTFFNPFELINNIENPAAAVNTITRLRKLLWNLFGFTYNKELGTWEANLIEEYDRGEREGELKVRRNIENVIPFYKKGSQFIGILGLDSKESIEDSYEFMIRN